MYLIKCIDFKPWNITLLISDNNTLKYIQINPIYLDELSFMKYCVNDIPFNYIYKETINISDRFLALVDKKRTPKYIVETYNDYINFTKYDLINKTDDFIAEFRRILNILPLNTNLLDGLSLIASKDNELFYNHKQKKAQLGAQLDENYYMLLVPNESQHNYIANLNDQNSNSNTQVIETELENELNLSANFAAAYEERDANDLILPKSQISNYAKFLVSADTSTNYKGRALNYNCFIIAKDAKMQIKNIRDLNASHIQLLEKVQKSIYEFMHKNFSLDVNNIIIYNIYPVHHFSCLMFTISFISLQALNTVHEGYSHRIHPLYNIIQNLKQNGDYYKIVTLSYHVDMNTYNYLYLGNKHRLNENTSPCYVGKKPFERNIPKGILQMSFVDSRPIFTPIDLTNLVIYRFYRLTPFETTVVGKLDGKLCEFTLFIYQSNINIDVFMSELNAHHKDPIYKIKLSDTSYTECSQIKIPNLYQYIVKNLHYGDWKELRQYDIVSLKSKLTSRTFSVTTPITIYVRDKMKELTLQKDSNSVIAPFLQSIYLGVNMPLLSILQHNKFAMEQFYCLYESFLCVPDIKWVNKIDILNANDMFSRYHLTAWYVPCCLRKIIFKNNMYSLWENKITLNGKNILYGINPDTFKGLLKNDNAIFDNMRLFDKHYFTSDSFTLTMNLFDFYNNKLEIKPKNMTKPRERYLHDIFSICKQDMNMLLNFRKAIDNFINNKIYSADKVHLYMHSMSCGINGTLHIHIVGLSSIYNDPTSEQTKISSALTTIHFDALITWLQVAPRYNQNRLLINRSVLRTYQTGIHGNYITELEYYPLFGTLDAELVYIVNESIIPPVYMPKLNAKKITLFQWLNNESIRDEFWNMPLNWNGFKTMKDYREFVTKNPALCPFE